MTKSWRLKIARWLAPELENALWATTIQSSLRYTALRNIAALRTPHCANIGKRMADIAEEALK